MMEEKLSECTTMIVGKSQSADGSLICARSEDFDCEKAKNLEIYEDTDSGPAEFMARDSTFRCQLPTKRLGYSAMPDYSLPGHWGSAGFNTAGVGMSSTETIFSSDKALQCDPLVESGIAENSVFNIILPYIHTAREGGERLGAMIEEYGSAEGYGVGFIDKNEIWYLETACGHRWLACKMPDENYFVTGNQSRFRQYDKNDKENYLASADLIEFAVEHGLYDPSEGEFDFHEAYERDVKLDTTYNYPRVFGLQKMFTPALKNDVTKNTFPVFAKAEKPIDLKAVRRAFRYHYDGTSHDPYLHSNPKEQYRPVSIFRTCQTHILTVRPWLPKEIGCCTYMAMGMADLGVFLPYYQGISSYPLAYTVGNDHSSNDSAYWKFRHVQALGMVDYNRYSPIIHERYLKFEAECDERQREMEIQYMAICDSQPIAAKELLQKFSDDILTRALVVTDELTENLFTRLCMDTQAKYMFHGA